MPLKGGCCVGVVCARALDSTPLLSSALPSRPRAEDGYKDYKSYHGMTHGTFKGWSAVGARTSRIPCARARALNPLPLRTHAAHTHATTTTTTANPHQPRNHQPRTTDDLEKTTWPPMAKPRRRSNGPRSAPWSAREPRPRRNRRCLMDGVTAVRGSGVRVRVELRAQAAAQ